MVWVPPHRPGGGTRHTYLREILPVSKLDLHELEGSDDLARYIERLEDDDAIVLELPPAEEFDTDAAEELARVHDRDVVIRIVVDS
jgi:hypothetical protein